MRIGIVSQSYYPIRGGVSEHVYHTARELEHLGHTVTVITASFSRFDDDRGLRVMRIGRDVTIPSNGAFVNMTVGWRLGRELEAIETGERFDLVHIHSPMDPILPLLALRHLRAPKVGTFHSYSEPPPMVAWLWSRFAPLARRLDGRIAVSSAAREFAERVFPAEYEVIPNGVDTDRFSPDQPVLPELADGNPTVLFVGRMDPRKGLKYLLRAFPRIAASVPNVRLVVVGNGLLRRYYQSFLPAALTARVRYVGFVPGTVLPRYYRSADVYCAPSVGGESFGIVLLEAMASGTPVVASNITGYNSVVHDGVEGRLVPPRDPDALADAIVELLRDPKRRMAMGQAGREKARSYSWPAVTRAIEEYFRIVLERVAQRPRSA